MVELPELWTVQEVAERLKCNPETVRRAIRAGRLGCYRICGCIRVSPDQVAAYLEVSLRPPREVTAILVEPTSQPSVVDEFRRKLRIRRALERQESKP